MGAARVRITTRPAPTSVIIRAWPMRSPLPDGRLGAFGLYDSSATNTATGEEVRSGGHGEQRARHFARRKASQAWAEVLRFLDEETRANEAEESGERDRREVEFHELGA